MMREVFSARICMYLIILICQDTYTPNECFHYADTCIQTIIFLFMKKIFKVKIHISKYMYKDIDLSTYEFLYSVRHSVFRLSDNRTGRTQSRFFNSLILLWLIYTLSYLLFFVVKLFSSFLRSKLSHMKKIRCSVHKTSFCFLKIVKSSDLQLRYLAINFFQCIFV